MALSKLDADSIDLADDYAFTGTVTGAGEITASTTVPSEGGAATTNVVQGLAKAWFQFDQTGPTTQDSFNTASITDNAAGDFTGNFTNSMVTAGNYSVTATNASAAPDLGRNVSSAIPTATSNYEVNTYNPGSNSRADYPYNSVVVHGDLA
jgi:hypothetical protein